MTLPDIPDAILQAMLAEDVPHGDLTTTMLGIGALAGVMTFDARDPMTLACAEEASRLLVMAGCVVDRLAASGDRLASGDPILIARGSAAALHRGWKVSQTLIEIASGIATSARQIVDAASSARPNVVVACTRKNVPGTKALSIKAIMAGGASAHRLGLSETILVFEPHRVFCGDATPEQTVRRLKRGAPEKKIMVEINSHDEGLAWARAGTDVLQADKMTPAELRSLIAAIEVSGARPIISAAGGVNASNAGDFAKAGVDVLVTSAPYTAKPLDVQVRMTRAVT